MDTNNYTPAFRVHLLGKRNLKVKFRKQQVKVLKMAGSVKVASLVSGPRQSCMVELSALYFISSIALEPCINE